jgi:hypothetical protein
MSRWDWLLRALGHTPTPAPARTPTPGEEALVERIEGVEQVIKKADKTMETARLELARYQRELDLMTGGRYE